VAWANKVEHIGARSYAELLTQWAKRSPVGIELGQSRLSEHIAAFAEDTALPTNGASFIGPIESRPLLSEIYCGVTKAFNLNLHAQDLAIKAAYTNGSLHSFNSIVQFMLAIMALFGVFIIRIGGRYYILDVFPSSGRPKEEKILKKQFGNNWWLYGRIIADTKETIEQKETVLLFQRCLRVVSGVGWREAIIGELIDCKPRWFNRSRNNILYNFTGWTATADLTGRKAVDIPSILREAARDIFDPDAQVPFGPLPKSLLLGSLLLKVWGPFTDTVVMEMNGVVAPPFPTLDDANLILAFQSQLETLLKEGGQDNP
jgi:hypothetical protein